MSEVIAWLAGWYNWPFLLTLGIGVLFIVTDLALGGVSDLIGLDAGGDLDVGGDADVDLDVDVDVDVDVDADLDLDGGGVGHAHGHVDLANLDPDVAAGRFGGILLSGLAWIGLGKVPISVLLEIMTITFGVVGLFVNAVAGDLIPVPGASAFSFPLAVLVAAGTAIVVTRFLGETIAKLVPADATTSRKPQEFVGEIGVTASRVTAGAGQVRIEANGTRPQTILNAHLAAGATEALPRGVEVLLSTYDAGANAFVVLPTSTLEP